MKQDRGPQNDPGERGSPGRRGIKKIAKTLKRIYRHLTLSIRHSFSGVHHKTVPYWNQVRFEADDKVRWHSPGGTVRAQATL